MHFRNVATEPDLSELNETSVAEESHTISREDTMVEHSVVVNEEINEEADYLKALDCAKFEYPLSSDTNQNSGECDIMVGKDGSSGGGVSGKILHRNNFMGFDQEED